MEIDPDEIEVYPPSGGSRWFASSGLNGQGKQVVVNYFVDEKQEVNALAHGLGIAHDISMHKEAEYIGPASDYAEFKEES